jgi:hypothetical protein
MGAAADVMAAVMLAFFVAGVAVGVIVVIALSARRADRRDRPASTDELPYLPRTGPDDDEPDRPPWWQERGD